MGNNQFCPRKYKRWTVVITFTSVDVRKIGYGQIFVRMEFDSEKNFHKLRKKICKAIFFCPKSEKKHQSNKKRFVAYSDLMIKSTRTVLFELLTDLHNGTIWTDKVLISKMRFAVNVDLLSNRQLKIPIKRKNQIIIHGYKQIKKLMKQKILRKIADNSISEWSFYNRIKSTKFGHLDVYCSPDIVYRSGSMWHLVRLNFQSENKQPFLDLELDNYASMV